MEQNGWPVTFSIGLMTFLSPPVSVQAMIHQTDTLMYDVKQSVKNMIKHDVWTGASPLAGAIGPALWLRDRVRLRHRAISRALPSALDLLTLSVEAGLDFAAGILNLQGVIAD